MQYFGLPKLRSIHSTPLDTKWCWRVLQSICSPSVRKKMKNLCFGPECTISGYQSCEASILLHWKQMMFVSVSEHFANLRQVKRCKTCVSGLNALFRGTKVVKHPFYSIGPKMMFGSVSEHFAILRHVKDAKPVFRAWMHNFGGTEVVKHPF